MRRLTPVLALLASASALAHGAYPLAYSVSQQPGQSAELLVGTTFGGVISHDSGASWAWVCEEAIGYGASATPKWLITSSGAMFTAGFRGLHLSRDRGCTWTPVADFTDTGASDVRAEGSLVMVTSAKYGVTNRVMRSTDDGATFAPVGPSGAEVFYSSVAIAPSRPSRLYVAEWWFRPAATAALHRSDDRGDGFTRVDLTQALPTASAFTVHAVSPVDPDLLFASVSQDADPHDSFLLRSADQGATFTSVLSGPDQFNTVAFSADGQTVYAATNGPMYRSTNAGLSFERFNPPTRNACAFAFGDALFACGWPEFDGFAVARAVGGAGLQPLLQWGQIAGVADCPADSRVKTICEPFFPALVAQFPPGTGADAGPMDPADAGPGPTTGKPCGCHSAPLGVWPLVLALFRRKLRPRNALRRR